MEIVIKCKCIVVLRGIQMRLPTRWMANIKPLAGTIGLRDADNDINKGAWIEFYGDGKLIGESARFVAGTRPLYHRD